MTQLTAAAPVGVVGSGTMGAGIAQIAARSGHPVLLLGEAADVVGRKVASAADVDTAMRLGVGYPVGPLEWGDRIGACRIVAMLDALARTYEDGPVWGVPDPAAGGVERAVPS